MPARSTKVFARLLVGAIFAIGLDLFAPRVYAQSAPFSGMAGAWSGDQIEYAWVAPNLTRESLDRQLQHLNQANVPVSLALPLRTNVVKAGAGSSQP